MSPKGSWGAEGSATHRTQVALGTHHRSSVLQNNHSGGSHTLPSSLTGPRHAYTILFSLLEWEPFTTKPLPAYRQSSRQVTWCVKQGGKPLRLNSSAGEKIKAKTCGLQDLILVFRNAFEDLLVQDKV